MVTGLKFIVDVNTFLYRVFFKGIFTKLVKSIFSSIF